MSTVNWVLSNSTYLVSSIDHLMCIATKGVGYNVTGSAPADYVTASYSQTVNIDCTGKTMIPIASLSGTYNGNNFEIQNWQNSQTNTNNNTGLFGTLTSTGVIKKVTMTGIIKIKGGFITGLITSTLDQGQVYDINIVFATGSLFNAGAWSGGVIGFYNGSYTKFNVFNVRVSGNVSIITNNNPCGGIVGYSSNFGNVSDAHISITGDIIGNANTGGIVGYHAGYGGIYGCTNTMTGNIINAGTYNGGTGGICGQHATDTTNGVTGVRQCINNMTGNISGTTYVGGIVGLSQSIIEDNINIMKGNIICTDSTFSSGIGYSAIFKYNRNIVATTGNIPNLISTTINYASLCTNNVFSNKFGMTVKNNTIAKDPLNLTKLVNLNSIPYQILTNTLIKMWDTTRSYPYINYKYTGLDGVARENRLINNNIPGQSIIPSSLTSSALTTNVTLTWTPITGYAYYKITLNAENTTDTVTISVSTNTVSINNLFAGTIYVASLYVSVDNSIFIDSGNRTSFTTSNLSTFNTVSTVETELLSNWTSVSGITSYRVSTIDTNNISTISINSTASTTGNIVNLQLYGTYIITLEGSSDNVAFIRLANQKIYISFPFVTWVASNSIYQVSSARHLLCMSSLGAGFVASGTLPADYMSSNYIQVSNIDCQGYIMTPIGSNTANFNGNYNGNNFEIQNWQNDQSNTSDNQGIFGVTSQTPGCIIYNLKVAGTINVKGNNNVGILTGNSGSTSIYNIYINCSINSTLIGNSNVGGLCGIYGTNSNYTNITVNNITIGGYLNITATNNNIGGIMGQYGPATQNVSTDNYTISIIGNITGLDNVGGIVGFVNTSNTGGTQVVLRMCKNNMTGNIIATGNFVGGIFGYCNTSGISMGMNAMTGNIQGSNYVGGIFGYFVGSQYYSNLINIMIGNIITSASDKRYCGAIGFYNNTAWLNCGQVLIAMKGNTPYLLSGFDNGYFDQARLVFSNKFGMTVNNAVITSATNFTFSTLTESDIGVLFTSNPWCASYMNGNYDSVNSIFYWQTTYSGKSSTNTTITITVSSILNYARYAVPISWTFSNGFYEIPDFTHLATLMQNGIAYKPSNVTIPYNNIGNVPSSWLSSSYKQTSNIDCSNLNLCTIANTQSNFQGIYDGNNFNIQNILYSSKGSNCNAAIFTNINNATIKNISLSSSFNVYGNNSNDVGNISLGGIVYNASNNNKIENCKVLTNGTIIIDSNMGLICNRMTGSNNSINKCYTNHIGLIDVRALGSNNTSGIILGQGFSSSNSHVLYCTNDNNGNSYLGEYYGGGIAGKNANVFGCINKSTGNLNGLISGLSYNCSGIIGSGKATNCINAIKGNLGTNTINASGICAEGFADYCVNNMVGNINSNSGYAISKSSKTTNCMNYMYGNTYDLIGGDIASSSNNFCAMNGQGYNKVNTSYNKYYGTLIYGLSNNISNISIRSDYWNIYQSNVFINYYSDTDLPILQPISSLFINSSNYYGPASNWEMSLSMLSNYKEFKYKYNPSSSNYQLYRTSKSNVTTITNPILADGTDTSILPFYLNDFIFDNNKAQYKSNLDTLLSTNSNLKTLPEASFYYYINNNSNQNYVDLSTFNNAISLNKNILKPALSKSLSLLIPDNTILKNVADTFFDINIRNRQSVDKLFVNSNTTLSTSNINALFSNNLDLLFLEAKTYSVQIDNKNLTIDTSSSLSGSIDIIYNNNKTTLNTTKKIVDLEYTSNNFIAVELTGIGSASITSYGLSNILYDSAGNNVYISSSDHFNCFINEGYGYHVYNTPAISFSNNSFIQTSDIDCASFNNVMFKSTFSGTYDGSNNALCNLSYTNDANYNQFALFRQISNSTIKNVNIKGLLNVRGSSNNMSDVGNYSYGGIVHTALSNCVIDTCSVKSSGAININDSCSLICNNITGSNVVITKCLTEYIGNISSSNYFGSILASGFNSNNSYVLYSSNNNVGNTNIFGKGGSIVGQNATIFSCTNQMNGNVNALSYGGIAYDGLTLACVNSMKGDIISSNNTGGIISKGKSEQCINGMIGNILGDISTTGGIGSHRGLLSNCLNVMKGDINGFAIGGHYSQSNLCAIYGKAFGLYSSNYNSNNDYAITDYGFNNSVSKMPVVKFNQIATVLKDNKLDNSSLFVYKDDFALPFIKTRQSYSINSNIYSGLAPSVTYPNVAGNSKIIFAYNMYLRRAIDETLIKLNVSDFNLFKVPSILLSYIVSNVPNKLNVDFDWDYQLSALGNVGIRTDNPAKTLDINGDMNFSGNLYKNNVKVNSIWLRENNQQITFINDANIGVGKNNTSYKLDINGSIRAQSYLTASDIKLKTNFSDESLGIEYIKQIYPKTYNYLNDASNKVIHGFIAQEIANDFVSKDSDGILSLNLYSLLSPITKCIQDIYKDNLMLIEMLNELENTLTENNINDEHY